MLFGPRSLLDGEVDDIRANLLWWQDLILLLSHLPSIPVIILTWRLRLYFPSAVVFFGLLASVAYHLCFDWNFACFHAPLAVSRMNDYIWASFLLVVEWLVVLRVYAHAWTSFVSLGAFAFIVYASLADPFSPSMQLFLVLIMVLLLFLKATLFEIVLTSDEERVNVAFDVAYRFYGRDLAIGLVLQAIALAAYLVSIPSWYWVTHSIWHLFGYIGLFYVIRGVTRDLIGWPGSDGADTGYEKHNDRGAENTTQNAHEPFEFGASVPTTAHARFRVIPDERDTAAAEAYHRHT